MTKNEKFQKMINGSWVEGALISCVEAGANHPNDKTNLSSFINR